MTELSLPKIFISHLRERDLPTPILLRETATHYIIDRDDPALPKLIEDANAMADGETTEAMAARVLIHSLIRQGVEV